MTNPHDPARRVVRAITDEGRNPTYHRAQLKRLRREWPTLYNALTHLVSEYAHRPKE